MTLKVTCATEADIPEWLELAAEVGELFGADMANDPAFRETLKRNIGRGTALCVKIDERLAGGMLYRAGSINWLAVRRAFRRRGVGRVSWGLLWSLVSSK
jgi:ribosomal protein S18 acetylase RimI-like enzyme